MEAEAAEVLRDASESGDGANDAVAVEAMLADIVAREWEVGRREVAVTVSEETVHEPSGVVEPAVLTGVSQAGAMGADGWPTGPSSSSPPPETDSIDAIRREAMAALDQSRLSEDWTGDDVEANGSNGGPKIDYGPSAPHRPKPSKSTEEADDGPAEVVESRYRRNSAKLPRIGIEPGTSSESISNLRKKFISKD